MGKLHEIQMCVHKEYSTAIHWPCLWLLLSSSGLVEAGSRCPAEPEPSKIVVFTEGACLPVLAQPLTAGTPSTGRSLPLFWDSCVPDALISFTYWKSWNHPKNCMGCGGRKPRLSPFYTSSTRAAELARGHKGYEWRSRLRTAHNPNLSINHHAVLGLSAPSEC